MGGQREIERTNVKVTGNGLNDNTYLNEYGDAIVATTDKGQEIGHIWRDGNYIQYIESSEKGCGSLLLKEAENAIKAAGANHVLVTSVPKSKGFFYKQGYRDAWAIENLWHMRQFSMIKSI